MPDIIAYIFSGWVALLPFIRLLSVQETAVIISFHLFVSYICVLFLLHRKALTLIRADIWYGLWLLVLTVSSVFGPHISYSFFGGDLKSQGILFFVGLWLIMIFSRLLRKSQYRRLCLTITASAVLQGIIVLAGPFINHLIPVPSMVFGRPVGTFGEPNMAAGYLAVSAVFIAMAVRNSTMKIMGLSIIALAVLATGSRTGMISLGVSGVGIILTFSPFRFRYLYRLAGVGILVILLTVIVHSINSVRASSPVENRLVIWKTGYEAFLRKPLIGYGAESGENVYRDAFYEKYHQNLTGLVLDRSHNLFLDLMIWSGLTGLIVFMVWFVQSVRLEVRKGDRIRIWGIAAWFVYAFFQPPGAIQWVLLILLFAGTRVNEIRSVG